MQEGQIYHQRYRVQHVLRHKAKVITSQVLDHKTGEMCFMKCLIFDAETQKELYEGIYQQSLRLKYLEHPQIAPLKEVFTEEDSQETKIYIVQEFIII